jgi:hypothetical protein
MKKPKYIIQKIVTTTDECYFQVIESSGVKVSLSKERIKGSEYYISVWGDDDTGMCMLISDFDEAKKIYDSIKDGISKKRLLEIGFEQW